MREERLLSCIKRLASTCVCIATTQNPQGGQRFMRTIEPLHTDRLNRWIDSISRIDCRLPRHSARCPGQSCLARTSGWHFFHVELVPMTAQLWPLQLGSSYHQEKPRGAKEFVCIHWLPILRSVFTTSCQHLGQVIDTPPISLHFRQNEKFP